MSLAAALTAPNLPRGGSVRQEATLITLLAAAVALYYYGQDTLLWAAGAAAALALIWWRLDLGLQAVLLAAPFFRFPKTLDLGPLNPLIAQTGAPEFSLAETLLWLCVAAWVLRRRWSPEETSEAPALSEWLLWLPPFAMVALAAGTLPFTLHLREALREYRLVVVEPALYYVLLAHTLRPADVRRFLYTLVLLGAAIALYGLYHYFFVGVVETTGGVQRILAIYHSPNALALFLGRVIPVAGALTLGGVLYRSQHNRAWWLAGFALLPMTACFYFTYSRGAFLGLAAALLLIVLLYNRRAGIIAFAIALVGVLALVPFLPQDRLLSATPVLQRLYVWQAALAMAAAHPLTGVGMDNFLYYYPQYILPQAALEPHISHPHNLFLDFWLRLGILGLALLAGLQLLFLRLAIASFQATPVGLRVMVIALIASMADFLVHGLIDNSYFLIDLAYVFWFTLALVAVLFRHTWKPASTVADTP